MLPVLVWIGVAMLGAATGFTGHALYQVIMTKWKGNRVAVLGARGVGKTTFMKFLTTGTIPEEYNPTQGNVKCEGRRFKLEDLKLRIKDSYDVTGSDNEGYALWRQEFIAADIVFYLLRANLLMDGDSEVEARTKKDLNHINDWFDLYFDKKYKKRPPFFIIGTHCDLDSLYSSVDDKQRTEYIDKFQKMDLTKDLVNKAGGRSRVNVILGSMKTIPLTETLVYTVFSRYAERSNK